MWEKEILHVRRCEILLYEWRHRCGVIDVEREKIDCRSVAEHHFQGLLLQEFLTASN